MISVVIPTIGEKILHKVIKKLLSGTIIPNEILLVFSENDKENAFAYNNYENTKILFCPFKGQVKQRIFGFRNANNKYVLQLDSDILVSRNTIELLFGQIIKNSKCCISPKIVNKDLLKKKFVAKQSQSGKITKWGNSIWFSNANYPNKIQELEWLQGGCIMHSKKNLIIDNYYPFKGKAYGEDVIHSCLLRKNKIKLYLNPDIKVFEIGNDTNLSYLNFKELSEFLKNNFLSKFIIVKLIKGSYFLFFIWFSLFFIKRQIIFIKNLAWQSLKK